jgi:hypothetical protein
MKEKLLLGLITISFFHIGLTQAANLVTNGGFETGDFSGWTISGVDSDPSLDGIYYGLDPLAANTGNYGAYFGPVGGIMTMSQTLHTTPGQEYTISFALQQDTDPTPGYLNSITVQLGSDTAFSATNIPSEPYVLYTANAVASSSSSLFRFNLRNDAGYFYMDDISVVAAAVPEPASFLFVVPALAGLYFLRRRRAASVPNN